MARKTTPRTEGLDAMVTALRMGAEPNLERIAEAMTAQGFSHLAIEDQLTAVHVTARTASHLDADQPETAASLRLAAVVAAETAGLSTVWGTEPHISLGPVIADLQAHGDPGQFDAILQHLDIMRREARTGVMLAGYPDPHQAEAAQRQRFLTVLESLGVPETVLDKIRTGPLANPEPTTPASTAENRPAAPRLQPDIAPTSPIPQRSASPTF